MQDHLERFAHTHYVVRRKILTLLGAKFHIYDDAGNVVLFSKMKAFKLKEDIRLYDDDNMGTELLHISARNIIDFSAAYDVHDVIGGERVGALRRRGMKSFLRDEWHVLDADDQPIGTIREDSMGAAVARRFVPYVSMVWPQVFEVRMGMADDAPSVCTMKQNFNPFVQKLDVRFAADEAMSLDPRLGLAAAVLLLAIEGKQDS